MDRASWEAGLARDGFAGPLDRRMEAGQAAPEHTHPFDARLLILDGAFILTCQGETRRYGPGESFELAANTPHAEACGPEGATYLVGRRARD
ncbi:cupin domain-containing protein [Roseomonas sp. AR75]|uniref:cupin domain-containing protein n=1 Tax=Roseomonas sp. AR75 TaxID=2562311 RepID=UPI0010BF6A49|nr:cupin domain-containing protein [Roseomonas sp. AR75]